MPDEIVTRILRLPGYGIYRWDADDAVNRLTVWIRQTAREPYYVCGGCGISVREIHSWTEREIRDLPWGTWTVWLRLEVHRVRCRRCYAGPQDPTWIAGLYDAADYDDEIGLLTGTYTHPSSAGEPGRPVAIGPMFAVVARVAACSSAAVSQVAILFGDRLRAPPERP